MEHITNEQLAGMIEESNKRNMRIELALFGDEDNDEQGLIKDMKEIKHIVSTSRTLWEAVKTIGKYVIGISAFSATAMYLKHLWDGEISNVSK